MSDLVQFYRLQSEDWDGGERLAKSRAARPVYKAEFWRPSAGRPFPPGRRDPRVLTYSLMHAAGMFATRDYAMILLRDSRGRIAHSSLIMPAFPRFPFMAKADLQIGATQTDTDHRGRGLAVRAIDETLATLGRPERTFWYLTDETNRASVSVIQKAGFSLAGRGHKLPRLGIRAIGFYAITQSVFSRRD